MGKEKIGELKGEEGREERGEGKGRESRRGIG